MGAWFNPDVQKEYAQSEYDFNVQWDAPKGALQGLQLRVRYAHITQAGPGDEHEDELRLLVYYTLR